MAFKFAGYPTALIYDAPDGKVLKQLLWGDHVRLTGPAAGGWQPVSSRKTNGVMRVGDLGDERLLEVVYVDIGQGDGALIVTPDDRHLLIDAGEADNMYRFLRWRYGGFAAPFTFEAAVISHPDADHYQGFAPIFGEPNVRLNALYHNGIVERAGADRLGPKQQGRLTDIVADRARLEAIVTDPTLRGDLQYPRLLFALLASGRCANYRGVSAADGHLPGFAPGQSATTIEVLGPVRDTAGGLPWFSGVGPTKNGHSVVLRLIYRDIKLLLGGDLNVPAEHHLLAHATGMPVPSGAANRATVIAAARPKFRADVAKACHHGSADFTDLYLEAVNPLATVISSGDDEPHAHPRADALGAAGRWGRGDRPLVFSTELARSAPETLKQPYVFRKQIDDAYAELKAAAPDTPAAERARAKVDKLLAKIERSVAVYGAINLRSDGRRIVMAQKVERPSRKDRAWDIYRLEPDAHGELHYVSKEH